MPVSSDIYSQVQDPKAVNPLAALAQAYQIKAYQSSIGKADREETTQNALLQAVKDPAFATMSTAAKAAKLQGVGAFDQAGKLVTAEAAANKDTRSAATSEFELRMKQLDAISSVVGTVKDQPSYTQGLSILKDQLGIDTSKFSPTYDPNGVAQFAQATLSAKDRLANQTQMRGQDITMRGQDLTQSTALAGQDVTRRGQDMSQSTALQGQGVTMRGQDLTDRRATEANQNGRVPSGYKQNADGSLSFIPGGPADPSTPKGKGNLTEGQSKSLVYASRMAEAEDVFSSLQAGEKGDGKGRTASVPGSMTPYIGDAITAMSPASNQKLVQAKRDWLTAVLRRESGAVISSEETANGDRQYFPQVGDSPEVIAQKQRNREVAQRGIAADVPDADKRIGEVRGPRAEKPSTAGVEPPAAAIAHLKANPALRAQFEAKYGRSAGSYLGQ